jgi:hypothetical protein
VSSDSFLTGPELLAVVAELPETASKAQMCMATGYVRKTEGGKTKYLYSHLLSAIVSANGLNLPGGKATPGGGPRPSFTTTALSEGHVVVGKCYGKMLGISKGDKFDITVNTEEKTITLSLNS